MSRLVVVSNRVAMPREVRAGGLAIALDAALRDRGGIWFGWSGRVAEDAPTEPTIEHVDRVTFATMDLSRRDHQEYYLGFANHSLWPLLHFRLGLVEYNRAHLQGYLRVNRLFAKHLAPLLRDDDTVWIHDYQLIPLARELRALGVDARIGFFLHTPLPPADLLMSLPGHRALFGALADCDLVGFHTPTYVRAFVDYCKRELGAKSTRRGRLRMPDGHAFRVGAFPIGIDTETEAQLAQRAENTAATRRLVASLEGRALVVGVDRLDYSKGLPERFQGFGRFLDTNPNRRARVSFLQIAPPSRSEVSEYRRLRAELERHAGAVNGRYAVPEWVPIRYVNRSFGPETLAGFYRVGRVGLVTPLRDGMNLVAKEFVACQNGADPGVLVLSRFAGAAEELKQAVIVNPYDADEIAAGIERALSMPLEERRARWQAMYAQLRRRNIGTWRDAFLRALQTPSDRGEGASQPVRGSSQIKLAKRPLRPPSLRYE